MSELHTDDREAKLDSQIKEELSRLSDTNPEVSEEKAPQDAYLEEALKMNYNPNYSGPDRKTPEEFVKNASFFRKINAQNKKIDELSNIVKQTMDHSAKLEKAGYEKALRDLEDAKVQAVSEGDVERYRAYNTQAEVVKEKVDSFSRPQVQEAPKITQELLDFQKRNETWFNNQSDENIEMAEAADFIDKRIAKQLYERGQIISQSEHLKMVEDKIKKLYPHRFEEDKKPTMTIKSSGESKSISKDELSGRLTESQRKFIQTARQYGSKLSNEEYAKQLDLLGELK